MPLTQLEVLGPFMIVRHPRSKQLLWTFPKWTENVIGRLPATYRAIAVVADISDRIISDPAQMEPPAVPIYSEQRRPRQVDDQSLDATWMMLRNGAPKACSTSRDAIKVEDYATL